MEKDAVAGTGQGQGLPRRGEGGRDSCYCSVCKEIVPHKRGAPCTEQKCPKCKSSLVPYTKQNAKEDTKQKIQKDTTPDEHPDAKKKLYYCPICKITEIPKGPMHSEYKCSKCGTNLVPYTGKSTETQYNYKGQELCICNVCGAKFKRIPGIKCEELFCRRCDSRLSPYIGTTQK